MDYQDLVGSQNYVDTISASYFNQIAPIVLVFKLLKENTKLNPIYNEEIDGRIYSRPFQLHSIYKTNPFAWSFNDTLPSEVDNTLVFYFNFNSMVQTINGLKNNACNIKITPYEDGWSITKSGDFIRLYKQGTDKEVDVDLNSITTLSELASYLDNTSEFLCFVDDDDYSKCIPDFKEIEIKNSVLLKTFNNEFKNVQEIVEQGDLIYISSTNALYEVNSAYPVNNTMYKYTTWQCNATRTFAYVEYERLKAYQYGFNIEQAKEIKTVDVKEDVTDFSVDDLIRLLCEKADSISDKDTEHDENYPGALSPTKVIMNNKQINALLKGACDAADAINDEEIN